MRPWSDAEKQKLTTLWNVAGPLATSRSLQRSRKACGCMAVRLGITGKQRRPWTTKGDDLVWAAIQVLAAKLGRTPDAIATRCRRVADQRQQTTGRNHASNPTRH